MITFPVCKINLGLHILSKREDGYHNIETLMVPVPFCDILEIVPSGKFSFSASGLPVDGEPGENLCVKAYRLLAGEFSLPPVAIHLHKVIPMGAGLGGGSSDAAYTLKMLNSLFGLEQSDENLELFAARLGSDCAWFVKAVPAIAAGRGEILTPVDFSFRGFRVVLVVPPVHVSTARAYAEVSLSVPDAEILSLTGREPADWKGLLRNDFESSVFRQFPEIEVIRDKLYRLGALYAAMSGSGSAVYGIFDTAVNIEKVFKGCVVWTGEP